MVDDLNFIVKVHRRGTSGGLSPMDGRKRFVCGGFLRVVTEHMGTWLRLRDLHLTLFLFLVSEEPTLDGNPDTETRK